MSAESIAPWGDFESTIPYLIDPIPLHSVGPKGLARYAKWTKRPLDAPTDEAGIVLFSALSPLKLEQERQRIETMARASKLSLS